MMTIEGRIEGISEYVIMVMCQDGIVRKHDSRYATSAEEARSMFVTAWPDEQIFSIEKIDA